MSKILVIHGPNLNLLGQREKDIYGQTTLEEINAMLTKFAEEHGVTLEVLQSNHEGEIVDAVGAVKENQVSAILINPAAYTHTSVAIRDAIAAVDIPAMYGNYNGLSPRVVTPLEGIVAAVSKSVKVYYIQGCTLAGAEEIQADCVQFAMEDADVIVAVMGVTPDLEEFLRSQLDLVY